MSISIDWAINAKHVNGATCTLEEKLRILNAINTYIGDVELWSYGDAVCEFYTTSIHAESIIDEIIRRCAQEMPDVMIEVFSDFDDGSGTRALYFGQEVELLDKITTWEKPKVINWPCNL